MDGSGAELDPKRHSIRSPVMTIGHAPRRNDDVMQNGCDFDVIVVILLWRRFPMRISLSPRLVTYFCQRFNTNIDNVAMAVFVVNIF